MGMKIKPSFKSSFTLASEGWHLFRIVDPRIEEIPKDKQVERDGITNDKSFIVKSVIEGGDEDGTELQEYFANYSKKEFGLSRLAGLMIKTESIPVTEEIDVDTMRTEKFVTKFKMSLPKRLFGGKVIHTKSKEKREGSEEHNTFANISEYATVKEYNEIISRTKGDPSPKASTKPSSTSQEPPKAEEKDPWA
jgi:hypothetical protein